MKYETRIELIGQMLEVAKDFTNEDHRDNRNAVSKLKAMYKRFTHIQWIRRTLVLSTGK